MDDVPPVNLLSLPGAYELTINYSQYHTCEQTVIIPFLESHGIKPMNGIWYTIDGDNHGPLIRGLRVRFSNGLEGEVFYG